MVKIINFSMFFLLLSTIHCYAQDGVLDPTLGDGGKVITNVTNYRAEASSIAVQEDNKIVVTGWFSNVDTGRKDFVTLRYTEYGILDSTYNNDGINITDLSEKDYAASIAIQEDGKIVLAGYTYYDNNSDFAVIRYCRDGSLDSTFNNNGIVKTPIGDGSDSGKKISIQKNGKIVVAGSTYNGTDNDFALVRYNSDGSLDHTFNNDGIVVTQISSGNDNVYSMSIQENGKIIVGGITTSDSLFAVSIACYTADGNLDSTFHNNGIITTSIDTASISRVNSLLINNEGDIFIAGKYSSGSECNYIIMKYNKNIELDPTFNKTGKIVISNCVTCNLVSDGIITIQNDNKIIFGGSVGANYDFMLIRYNSNGSIDNSFGDNGQIITDFDNEANFIFSLNVYNDKIIAGGLSVAFDQSHFYVALSRYNVVTTDIENNSNFSIAFDYILQQNYPNPFNPNTTINYAIPTSGLVQLKVYDILGREVAVLVNKEQARGNYKVVFNAPNLTSGIYFYKLQSGSFAETKKLILLR